MVYCNCHIERSRDVASDFILLFLDFSKVKDILTMNLRLMDKFYHNQL
jgi:hypothetical protein